MASNGTRGLTRRQLLIGGAVGTLALSLPHFAPRLRAATTTTAPMPLPDYRGWEDIYRAKWMIA